MFALSIEKKRELRVFLRMLANAIGAIGLVTVLASCGDYPGYNYTVGGTVSGMVGSGMVLQNNGGDDLSISANSSFSFATQLTDGAAYSVTVKTQPTNPSQTCTVSNGSATVNGARVDSVVVNCVTGPTSVAVDPSGKFAYATNTNGTISAYTINQTTGALTAGTAVAAGTYPTSVVTVLVGLLEFAYAIDTIGGTIYAYTIDQTTGALTAGTPVATGTYPTSITVDPSGKFAYVSNMGANTISAYQINSDGTLTDLGTAATGNFPTSVVTVLVGSLEFAYATNSFDGTISVYQINSDGTLATETAVTAGTYPTSVTVDPSGKFAYATNESSNNISVYQINSDGTLTAGTAVATGTYPTSVVTVLVGSLEFAYATNSGDGTISVYTIDQTSGALTVGTAVAAGTYPSSITVDPFGRFAYVANMGGGNILVYKINPDGTLTPQ